MATITAHISTVPVSQTVLSPVPTLLNPSALGGAGYPIASPLAGYNRTSDRFIYYPLVTPPAIQASKSVNFTDAYYYRIHVVPHEQDVGNVSTTVSYKVEVWNAFFVQKTLTALTTSNADGVNILNGISAGNPYGALQSVLYDIEVTTDGPATIDAEIRWVFGLDYGAHFIIGNRVVLFPFKPAGPISEMFSWLTDVLRSYSKEQRIALRRHPRQSWIMRYKQWETVQTRMNSAMWGRNWKPFGLPIWTDVTYKYTSIPAGTSTLYFDTQYFDYRAEGLLVLLYRDDLTNETKEISEVYSDRVVLARPTETAFPDGAMLMPVIICRPEGGLIREEIGNDVTVSMIKFRAMENLEYVTSAAETYLGYEFMSDWNYRTQGAVKSSIVQPTVVVDGQTGPWDVFAYRDKPDEMWDWSWTSNSPAERWAVKMFLMRMRGQQKSFWISTRRKDFILTATVPPSSSEWTVENMGQDLLELIGDPRHVEVILNDGTVYRREIIGLTDISTDKQTMVVEVSATMPVSVAPEDVKRISYLRLVRFNSDEAEIVHSQGITSDLTMPLVTVDQPTGLGT